MTGRSYTDADTRTRIRQQDQEQRETERQQARKPQDSSSSTTTSSYHTDPGVSCIDLHDLEVIRQFYTSLLGPLNYVKAAVIEQAMEAGIEASAILDALEQTGIAARPSHSYFAAIIRRYMREGITTQEKAEEQRWARQHAREMARVQREQAWYKDPADDMPW